jgi:MFS family permease
LAIFTDILFYGLIVPVIPFSLSAQVGVPDDEVQHWTAILLACYNAALVVGSPVAGFYADHTSSRRWPFVLGLVALCASTLLLCLGKTIALLVVGRILQGLSAAIVWSVGLALLVDTVGRDVGFAMGWVNIAMSVGLLISPVIGGAVYAAAGYYAVYYLAFAVICCDIALRLVLIEKKVAREWLPDSTNEPQVQPEVDGGAPESACAPQHEKTSREEYAGGEPTASLSARVAGIDSGATLSAARHSHRELAQTRRVLAVLLAVVAEAAIV